MPCEHCKNALIEAAVSSAQPQGELRAHLDACASCRATFEQEHSLFASIDAGLHTAANVEVPPSLAVRVRALLDAEPAPRLLAQKWAYSGGILVAVLAVAAVLALRSQQNVSSPQLRNSQPPGVLVAGKSTPSAIPAISRKARRRTPAVNKGIGATSPRASLAAEILVPEEERVAFAQFLAHGSPGPMSVSASAMLAPKAPEESVQISPVEVASLKLDSLNKEDGQQTDF